jgi:acyl-CoA thioesterase
MTRVPGGVVEERPAPTFAQDTALETVGDGAWRATYDERWAVIRGPFGGWMAAVLARALRGVTDWPPRTLAIHFLDAPTPGTVDVSAKVERSGRSSCAVSLRADQGGRAMARALASAGSWRPDEPAWSDLERPDAPPPESLPRLERRPQAPAFFEQLDLRWVSGAPPAPPGGEARNVLWASAGPLDVAALAALSDVVVPPAFSRLGRFAIVPTLDLTIHFRGPLPEGEEWVLADHRSEHAAGGTWTCDGHLWSRDGRLLAQARQLALLRT